MIPRAPSRPPSRRGARVALALLCLLAGGAASAGDGCFEPWQGRWLERAERRIDGPEALLPLRVAMRLAATAPDHDRLYAAFERLRARRDADPLVAALLDRTLMREDLRRGDVAAAEVRRARLGLVNRFTVTGPLELEVERPPEDAAGLAVDTGPEAVLDIGALIQPAGEAAAVARFSLAVTRPTRVAIRVGLDDRGELFADGLSVARFDGPRQARLDQETVTLELPEGRHEFALLLRHRDGPWRAIVRVTDAEGRALPLVTGGDRGAPARPARRPARDAVRELERRARRGKPDGQARLALELAARGIAGHDGARAVELARAAAERRPADPEIAWALVLVENDPNRARDAVARILERDPEDAGALRRLAQHYVAFEQNRRAREVIERARAACSERDAYLDGWLALFEDVGGYRASALATLERMLERGQLPPDLLARRADLLRREGMVRQAIAAYRTALAADRLDGDVRRRLYDLLRLSGHEEEAQALVDEALALRPLDHTWRFLRVRTLLAEGEAAAARAALAPLERAVIRRADVDLLAGEVALAEGRRAEAAAAWQRALDAGAGPANLAERIAALTGEKDSFADRWTEPLETVRERIESAPAGLIGDAPAVVAAHTVAYRVRPNGLAQRFRQLVFWVRRPAEVEALRTHSITYSPRLQQAHVLEARLVREDGTVVHASRGERALLPDLELRMWYDTRVVELTFPRLEAGDLIELRYRIDDRGPTNPIAPGYFGDVTALGSQHPTLFARLAIEAPGSLPVRYVIDNVDEPEEESSEEEAGWTRTLVRLPPLPAYPEAPGAPPFIERVPYAVLSTVESWEELARIYARLIENQVHGSPDITEIVDRLRKKHRRRPELIEAMYDWVIENTRYVALELGIHSLKPYDVADVLRRRHGDCKDKASLLVAMLEEAGIDADIALLRTRDNGEVDTSLPAFSLFDHAVVRVPEEDLWLDGTVLHHGAHELPIPDHDGLALVVDDETGSGALVRTPRATPSDSSETRTEEIEVGPDGTARIKVSVESAGERAARVRGYFRLAEHRGAILQQLLRRDWPDSSVRRASFPKMRLDDERTLYRFEAEIPRYARVDGPRLSLPLATRLPAPPAAPPGPERRIPLDLPPPFERTVRTRLTPVGGCRITRAPASATARSEWGEVSLEVEPEGAGLALTARHLFLGGTVAPERMPEFSAYVTRVREVLEQRIELDCGAPGKAAPR